MSRLPSIEEILALRPPDLSPSVPGIDEILAMKPPGLDVLSAAAGGMPEYPQTPRAPAFGQPGFQMPANPRSLGAMMADPGEMEMQQRIAAESAAVTPEELGGIVGLYPSLAGRPERELRRAAAMQRIGGAQGMASAPVPPQGMAGVGRAFGQAVAEYAAPLGGRAGEWATGQMQKQPAEGMAAEVGSALGQAAMTAPAILSPAAAVPALAPISSTAARQKFEQTGSIASAVGTGFIELATEYLPLGVIRRMGDRGLEALGRAVAKRDWAGAGRVLKEVGGIANVEGVEELAALVGENALDASLGLQSWEDAAGNVAAHAGQAYRGGAIGGAAIGAPVAIAGAAGRRRGPEAPEPTPDAPVATESPQEAPPPPDAPLPPPERPAPTDGGPVAVAPPAPPVEPPQGPQQGVDQAQQEAEGVAGPAVGAAEHGGEGTARQPWQMTREEWSRELDRYATDWQGAGPTERNSKTMSEANRTNRSIAHKRFLRYGIPDQIGEGSFPTSTPADHRDVIEKALGEGKPVPPEVLADYPDLKAAQARAAPRSLTIEQFRAERGVVRPQIDHSFLSPSGRISKRARDAYMARLAKQNRDYDAAFVDYQAEIDAGTIIDPSGVHKPTDKITPRIAALENDIRTFMLGAKTKSGKPTRQYQRAIDKAQAELDSLRAQQNRGQKPPTEAAAPAPKGTPQPEPWQMTRAQWLAAAPRADQTRPAPTIEALRVGIQTPKGKPGITEEPVITPRLGVMPDERQFIYRDDAGEPVGILTVTGAENPILQVAVDPAHRRKGVATALYDAAEAAGVDVRAASGVGGFTEEGASLAHARAVRRAIAEGKPVPAEVRAEYGPPKEPPVATEPAEPPDRDPTHTSARKAWMAEDREAMGLDTLNSPERRSWQETLDTAEREGLTSPDRAMRLATEVNLKPRAFSDVETAGLVAHATKLKTEHARLASRIAAESDPAAVAGLSAEMGRVEGEFDALSRALRSSGTEKGRALAAQKLTLDRDMSLVAVKSRAKAAKGKELTEKESKRLELLAGELEAAASKIADLEAKIAENTAERAVRVHRRAKRDVPPNRRRADRAELVAKARALLKAGCKD